MRPDFDVVIVQYDGKEIPSEGIEGTLDAPIRVTVIDNRDISNSREEWGYNLGDGRRSRRTTEYSFLCPGENLGWVKGANVGLALSTAPYVVLMNDDCEVKTDDWLGKFRRCLDLHPRIAAIGPRSARRESPGIFVSRSAPDRCEVWDPVLTLDGFGIGRVPLSFSCVCFRRDALEEIGYLDERLGHGYGGDDDDWQARAHLAGWQLAVHPQVEVTHQGGASWHGEAKAQAQAKNVKILREMWRGRL